MYPIDIKDLAFFDAFRGNPTLPDAEDVCPFEHDFSKGTEIWTITRTVASVVWIGVDVRSSGSTGKSIEQKAL
jgi:hypothetical protein